MTGNTNCYGPSAIIRNYETTCYIKRYLIYIGYTWVTIRFTNCEG